MAGTSVDLVSIEGLTVAYPARTALEDVHLAIPPATSVALIGPNGSGKSSLLRAIAGLLAPRPGWVAVDAARRVEPRPPDHRRRRALPLTVGEAVAWPATRTGAPRPDDPSRPPAAVDPALERLDVADLAGRQLRELSGGQRQRVLVAQGLAQEADLRAARRAGHRARRPVPRP